jgi:DnaK suppressor protein
MKKNFLENVKESLIERRREIIGSTQEDRTEKDTLRAKDTGDEALEISMERLESSIRTSEMDELKLVEQALKRIEQDSYGVCIDCQGKISETRLECFPYVARCIVCQEKFEG